MKMERDAREILERTVEDTRQQLISLQTGNGGVVELTKLLSESVANA